MALANNKVVPILAVIALGVVAVVGWKVWSPEGPMKAGPLQTQVPRPEPSASQAEADAKMGWLSRQRRADGDKPNEVLTTLIAKVEGIKEETISLRRDNVGLRDRVQASEVAIKQEKDKSRAELSSKAMPGGAAGRTTNGAQPPITIDDVSQGLQAAGNQAEKFVDQALGVAKRGAPTSGVRGVANAFGVPDGLGFESATPNPGAMGTGSDAPSPGAQPHTSSTWGSSGRVMVKPYGFDELSSGGGVANKAVQQAWGRPVSVSDAQTGDAAVEVAPLPASLHVASPNKVPSKAQSKEQDEDQPVFTLPENATLTRVTAMTALVGRIPVDGRVQDPMQFKVIVGRENLAANGVDIPDEVSGIVMSGVAVGDLALSCSEGYIRSMTFVFADGTVRTVSNRRANGASSSNVRDGALGYISDEYGNPCVGGSFKTNAPSYLADTVGFKALAVAGKAYAAAQTTSSDNPLGGSSTSVTGNRGAYVLGQAAGSAVDEVSNWISGRMRNSFDAVITPAGRKVVVHINQEIHIDRVVNARRLDHRVSKTSQGDRHGLD
jgi:integrating conjugative element protein (TIGR03752 family)